MKLSNQGPVPVYTISGSSTARPLPEWLARKRKRSLKQDPEYASRIELLQDFEFEESSSCIRISDDGDWVVSTGKFEPPKAIDKLKLEQLTLATHAIGTYKPQIHVHYLPNLSLSFARHTDALNRSFVLLSSDYSKSLHLQTDRSLEFQTASGCHYRARIPRYGRDLVYDKVSAEALIPSVGVDSATQSGEVFRLNLELGRFMKPYSVDVGGDDFTSLGGGALQGGINTGSVNTAAIAEDSHNLLAFGTSLGTVEFWDPRSRTKIGVLQPPRSFSNAIDLSSSSRAEITALQFHHSGLSLATGSSNGLIHLYDLRSPAPLLKKDQGYGFPIHTLNFLSSPSRTSSESPLILSSDKRIIKIWDQNTGAPWTHVEAAVDLNSIAWYKDSGMILTANEGRQQHSFFIPQLGPAPRWCSFLDNLVEEMAEDASDPNAYAPTGASSRTGGEVYDNYKFVTLSDLKALHLEDKVGTSLLKPYMHGYFIRQELYEEARILVQPELWAEQRQKSIREKIEKERESRIRGSKKAVTAKVNRQLAQKMLEREEKNERRKARRALRKEGEALGEQDGKAVEDSGDDAFDQREDEATSPAEASARNGLLNDPRFASLFQDQDFAIDETSYEFQALNPSTKTAGDDENVPRRRALTAVEEELAEERRRRSSNSDMSSSDGNDEASASEDDVRLDKQASAQAALNGKGHVSYQRSGKRNKFTTAATDQKRQSNHPAPRLMPKMQVSSSRADQANGAARKDRSFGDRISRLQQNDGTRREQKRDRGAIVGAQEASFTPSAHPKSSSAGQGRTSEPVGRKAKDRRSASGNTLRNL